MKTVKDKKQFEVHRGTLGTGFGLYTNVTFKKGDFVIEYVGKRITNEAAEPLTTKYLFEVDDTWTIDGSERGNVARYINHGCKPNCESDIKDGRVFISAIKNINEGEELTYDYGTEYFKQFIKPHGCKCVSCIAKRLKKG